MEFYSTLVLFREEKGSCIRREMKMGERKGREEDRSEGSKRNLQSG